MKILHLSSASSWRGGEQQIAYLIEELHRYGVENVLFCPRDSVLGERNIPDLNLKIRYQKRGSIDLFVSRTLRQITHTENIDLIHIHDTHAHNYAWAAANFWRMKTPCLVTCRVDFGPNKGPQRKFNHPSIKRIICISEAVKHQVQHFINEPEKIVRIYDGIDVEKFKSPGSTYFKDHFELDKNCLLFGNIAAIAKHKDYGSFVKLAKRYNQSDLPKARFLIIGADAGEEKRIRKLVHDLELEETVLFTGFQAEIEKKIFELDALVCTSRLEGLGSSVLDAFAAKIPVISTDAGGLAEIAIHEKTALSAAVGDVDQMLENIKRLLFEKDLKGRLIENAWHFVQDFDKKKIKNKVFEVYEHILKETTP